MNEIRKVFVAILLSTGIALPVRTNANALQVINSLRVDECRGHLRNNQSLNSSDQLANAARRVKNGVVLRDAINRAGYRADQSAVIHISGTINDATLRRMLAKSYCTTLTDPHLVDVGIFSTDQEIAMVFAAPFAPPAPDDAPIVAKKVLKLVNEARSQPRRCGKKQFSAAPPVTLNERLLIAAKKQAKDLAARGSVSHEGTDGSSPGDRVTRAGYVWKFVGENVAAGQLTAKEVVDDWLSSPGHCINIMDADFTQMAVAYVINPKQEMGIYWAQVFGRPR